MAQEAIVLSTDMDPTQLESIIDLTLYVFGEIKSV